MYNRFFLRAWYLCDYASKTKIAKISLAYIYIGRRIATPHVDRVTHNYNPHTFKIAFLAKTHNFLGRINNRLYGMI